MSAVETGQMSAAETGQMSAVETGQMSVVETKQMSSVARADICLVPTHNVEVSEVSTVPMLKFRLFNKDFIPSASAIGIGDPAIGPSAIGIDWPFGHRNQSAHRQSESIGPSAHEH